MREIKKIILHCSDSDFGSASLIRKWHVKERGWDDIGYHYVITNGVQASMYPYVLEDDGVIQEGRPVEISGAHVKGQNSHSIGICLIGKHHFTARQLYDSLPTLLQILLPTYGLTFDNVYGHNEFNPEKTCPNFSVYTLRNLFKETINVKSS
jgi:N-acetylmuramoyl-L-alanine amidase